MLSLSEVKKAAKNCADHIKKTPLIESKKLGIKINGKAFLKCENLQKGHSFKIRGVIHKLSSLKEKGIVSCSAGNFGIALAEQCRAQGIKATIVVPKGIPRIKIEKLRGKGAKIIEFGSAYEEAEKKAKELAKKKGLSFLSPYNDTAIIAGNGTIALEILQEQPQTNVFLCGASGGALASGIGFTAKNINKNIQVFGVQSTAAKSFYESIKAGKAVKAKEKETIADSLRGPIEKDSITLHYAKKFVDGILLVKEQSIREAIRFLWKEHSLKVEGAGAIGVAALLEQPEKFHGKNVAVVLSGGNIDWPLFKEIVGE